MSKRSSPPRGGGGEGPSRKRPRQDPPTAASLRAEALERIIGSRGRPSRPAAAEATVPASELGRVREENER
ncbi:unnamed protein product, partial [Larinioides sclopetarius]